MDLEFRLDQSWAARNNLGIDVFGPNARRRVRRQHNRRLLDRLRALAQKKAHDPSRWCWSRTDTVAIAAIRLKIEKGVLRNGAIEDCGENLTDCALTASDLSRRDRIPALIRFQRRAEIRDRGNVLDGPVGRVGEAHRKACIDRVDRGRSRSNVNRLLAI